MSNNVDDNNEDTHLSSIDSPYNSSRTKNRSASGATMTFMEPGPILLVDHTVEPSDQSAGLFARNVYIGDYTVVSGTLTKAGAYVVWNCTVETLEVCPRYH